MPKINLIAPVALATMAPCILAGSVAAQITLDAPVSIAVGSEPSDALVVDLNGDGHSDVATLVNVPDSIVTLLNDGAGNLVAGPVSFLAGGLSAANIIAADFTGDGIVDIAVSLKDPNTVMIMPGNGVGGFASGTSYPVGVEPRRLAIGDVNADGQVDIAVANRDSATASVLINNGAGAFTVVSVVAGDEPRDVLLVDVNNDGFDDLVVSCHDTRDVRTFISSGAGTFAPSAILSVGGLVRPDGLAAADFDGNGFVDIATSVSGQNDTINNVARFMNNGNGFAGPFVNATLGINPSGLEAVDLDCDGQMDIVVTNQGSANFAVLHNTGGAIFATATLHAVGLTPEEVGVGDISGNGSPDIAVANRDSGSISIAMNSSCVVEPPVPGDLNDDGAVDGADLGLLLNVWGACGDCAGCPADFNGDCIVDGADLGFLLTSWG